MFYFFLPDYFISSTGNVATSFSPIGSVQEEKKKLPVDWYGGRNGLKNGNRQVQKLTWLWGNNKKAANEQALMLAGSLSWANVTSKDTLRAKLNKNLVKDTRVAVSASEWIQHILCQGHSFCFWHFVFLEVESSQFLRKFAFGMHHVHGLPSLSQDGKWCCFQWQSFDNCCLGVAVRQQ